MRANHATLSAWTRKTNSYWHRGRLDARSCSHERGRPVSHHRERCRRNRDGGHAAYRGCHAQCPAKALASAAAAPANATVIGADTIVVLDGASSGSRLTRQTHAGCSPSCPAARIRSSRGCASCATGKPRPLPRRPTCGSRIFPQRTSQHMSRQGNRSTRPAPMEYKDEAARLVDSVDGDYDNVVGLPVARLERALDLEGGDEIDDGQHGE